MAGASAASNRYPGGSGVYGLSIYLGATAITAAIALWMQEGRTTIMPPIMVGLILLSCGSKFRLERTFSRFIARAILYIAVLVVYRVRPPAYNDSQFVDSFMLDQFGELFVAEVLIRAWSYYSSARYNGAILVLPIGIVFVIATNTSDDMVGRYFTPVFIVLLTLGIQGMRPRASAEASKRAMVGKGFAVAFTAVLGMLLYQALYVNRTSLTDWANRVLNSSNIPIAATGLSEESHLGSVFGRTGSFDRVLRIHTTADVSYMRAYPMYNYHGGFWGPSSRTRERDFDPVGEVELQTSEDGVEAKVFRYSSTNGMILSPLNAVSISIDGTTHLRWDKAHGGPLRCDPPGPDNYSMTIGSRESQGLLCAPPDPEHLKQLLEIPTDVNPKVKGLAAAITAGITDPLKKADAIERYLPAHHAYSVRIRVDSRDPIGDFLFSDKAAHCEFFASSAVVLMRCAGVPARYVIGYYAHEQEDGDIVVRQRDAHAWAECWIKGTGWVTIDATPGSGKPNGDVGSIPGWKKTVEKIQDWFGNLRRGLTRQNLLRFAGAMVCLTLLGYLLQNRYHFSFKRVRRIPVREYAPASAELRALYARFEVIARKCGLMCPASLPWQQYLHALPNWDEAVEMPSAAVLTAASEFIQEYDLARFGRAQSAGEGDDLNTRLESLEREANRFASEENSI